MNTWKNFCKPEGPDPLLPKTAKEHQHSNDETKISDTVSDKCFFTRNGIFFFTKPETD